MLTSAPFDAFADPAASELEQPARDEQATENEEVTQVEEASQEPVATEQTAPQIEEPKAAAETPEHAVGENTLDVVYVSRTGDDKTGLGTKESPLESLEWAVRAANDGATIYVMSDLDAHGTARFFDKHLVIESFGDKVYTVKRSETFSQIQDSRRSTYNGAMIEAGSENVGSMSASLTLRNITLDDAGLHEGRYFTDTGKESASTLQNEDIVQDGIIATYDGTAKIILDGGTTLKDFGGMSAVRLSGGELVMKAGSKIEAPGVTDRTLEGNDSREYGPAGALWIQGGTVVMEQDSEISNVVGRAIYEDGGDVTVNGTISNIKGDGDMWQGRSGIAIHVRGDADAKLGASGVIDAITTDNSPGTSLVISTVASDFEAVNGSKIINCKNVMVAHANDSEKQEYTHNLILNGEVRNCTTTDSLFRSWYGLITVGPTGLVTENTARGAGGLFYTDNGSRFVVEGKVTDNTASKGAFYLANQGGGTPMMWMKEGASISNNSSLGVRVNNGSIFNMEGGTISGNGGSGVQVTGKLSYTGASFNMIDGEISDNKSYGVEYSLGGKSRCLLNGGHIFGNKRGELKVNNDYVYSAGAYPCDTYDHLSIASGVLQGRKDVLVNYGWGKIVAGKYQFSKNRDLGTITFDEDYGSVGIAYANPKAVDTINSLLEEKAGKWTAIGQDAYWIRPSADTIHFNVTRPKDAKKTALFAVYIPMNADGTPAKDAKLQIKEVANTDPVDVTLEGLTPDTSYALMFVNNNEYTLKPDTTTVYVGGAQGKDGEKNGLPVLSVADSIDKINKDGLEVDGKTVSGSSDELAAKLLNMLQVTYLDESGKEVTDDSEPGAHTAKLAWKDGAKHKVRINGNDVKGFADGSLIVRYVSDAKAAKAGENVTLVVKEGPTEAVNKAAAEKKSGYYLNGNSNFRVANAGGIALMDDDALTEGSAAREQALEDKAKSALPGLAADQAYRYDFHFLDLVDTNNGNAYVTPTSGDTTVYLPYPKGTDQKTEFQLVHLNGLNREYGINGQAGADEAITASTAEAVSVENLPAGIKFSMPKGEFGLYALAWATTAHTVDASVDGKGGTIAPSGAVTVGEGADKAFDITPADGYVIADVMVDGESVGAVSSYTFKNVEADHTIVASFRKAQHNIVATAGEGGAIDPVGNVAVKDGSYQKFTITPNKGYKIADVKVDGQSVGKVESYEFTDVMADHTIEVTFEAKPTEPAPDEKPDENPTDPDSDEKPKPGDNTDKDNGDNSGKADSGKTESELPRTGDSSGAVAVIAVAGAAAAAAGAIMLRKREER